MWVRDRPLVGRVPGAPLTRERPNEKETDMPKKMHQSGLPKKSKAQETLREIKTKAAKAAENGDRLAARQLEAHAELITSKLGRGDYKNS